MSHCRPDTTSMAIASGLHAAYRSISASSVAGSNVTGMLTRCAVPHRDLVLRSMLRPLCARKSRDCACTTHASNPPTSSVSITTPRPHIPCTLPCCIGSTDRAPGWRKATQIPFPLGLCQRPLVERGQWEPAGRKAEGTKPYGPFNPAKRPAQAGLLVSLPACHFMATTTSACECRAPAAARAAQSSPLPRLINNNPLPTVTCNASPTAKPQRSSQRPDRRSLGTARPMTCWPRRSS